MALSKQELIEREELIKKLTSNIIITRDENMRDYSKDPTAIKRLAEAKAFIKKVGLPDWAKKKRK